MKNQTWGVFLCRRVSLEGQSESLASKTGVERGKYSTKEIKSELKPGGKNR